MRRRIEIVRVALYAIIFASCSYGLYVLDHPKCQGDEQPSYCKD
jgi:hypothetical protein